MLFFLGFVLGATISALAIASIFKEIESENERHGYK